MDIAALSMSLSQMNVRQEASVLVTKKAMDQAEANSASVVKMLEQSVQPHIGSSIDLKG
ncbi:YjfB family protein [Planococcus sp. CP5-4]|uniref:YjfB family protein n=1 Tax=unclassified Planococcus (in: firmicutes) TaxID=2662419 RepID=UPI001C237CDA|nr:MULTISPECIES: YjfB family protein [unclassified Planococcus (in: firmicutes)]MBU9672622.1 YjfB family protein [Planococcus sp. CP5-4_YE]MBV0909672.1 YjfB family protein [Planococcus sp. CP5-4_UN]MBW6064402.1 YjfB family protein [Planococcus sp. CP5-4]